MENDYTKMYAGNFIVVELIKGRLAEIGIVPIIKDEAESNRLTGFPTTPNQMQEVWVSKDEYTKALTVMESVKDQIESSKETRDDLS